MSEYSRGQRILQLSLQKNKARKEINSHDDIEHSSSQPAQRETRYTTTDDDFDGGSSTSSESYYDSDRDPEFILERDVDSDSCDDVSKLLGCASFAGSNKTVSISNAASTSGPVAVASTSRDEQLVVTGECDAASPEQLLLTNEQANGEIMSISEDDVPDLIQEQTDDNATGNKKRTRKRTRNKDEWKREKAKLARNQGKEYINYKGETTPAKVVPSAEVLCKENCRLVCFKRIPVEARQELFNRFYKHDTNAKNTLLYGCIEKSATKRPVKGAAKPRSCSFKYFVKGNGTKNQICKPAICKLFGINRKKIDLLCDKMKRGLPTPSPDKRGTHKNRPLKIPDELKQTVRDHIKKFPTEKSHYSRNENPNREYLSPLLTVRKMYDLYVEEQNKVDNTRIVSPSMYREIFVSEFNLGFGTPKSDTCKLCDKGETDETHKTMYKAGFDAIKKDREKALEPDGPVFVTFDMQQTMPLPKLSTSIAFYLRQVWLYNEGIHVVTQNMNNGHMHIWTEDEASRGSDEVASCLYVFLTSMNFDNDQIVLWSDSCSGQGRNFYIVCLWQYLVLLQKFKCIDQKFPVVGHSMLDSDRDFGLVEQQLRKRQNIYSPDEYRDMMRDAKCTNKFSVTRMKGCFYNFKALPKQLHLVHRTENTDGECVPFQSGIRWIRVDKFGEFKYKESFDPEAPFKTVQLLNKRKGMPTVVPTLNRIARGNRCISKEKWKDIQEQLDYIPAQHKSFYEALTPSP